MKLRIVLLSLITVVCMMLAWPLLPGRLRTNPFAALPPVGGEVHGSIMVSFPPLRTPPPNPNVLLPDVDVYLQDVHSLQTSPLATTDLDGNFRIPSQFQSDYQLCWQAVGYVSGCGATFTLGSSNVYLDPVSIKTQGGVIYGRVALQDGSPCRYVSTFIGLNTSTTLFAQPTVGFPELVHANNSGEYVLSGLFDGSLFLGADCEGAHVFSLNSIQHGAPIQQNFTLPNTRPTAYGFASVGGSSVHNATPGTTVQATVQAKAGGAYPLHYKWYLDPPVQGFVSTDTPTINWTVPGPGAASAYVWAGDGHGGNVVTKVSLSTTPNRIPFSGRIVANDSPGLANANVDINGFTTRTDANGYFSVNLPKEARRYVLTVTAAGYQMLSKALYNPVVGGTYLLYRAQDFLVDPTKPIFVTETNTDGSARTHIAIPANSLAAGESGAGILATSPLHIRVLTYDPNNPDNPLPGDFGGIDSAGTPYRLATFGAVDIEIQDAAGQHFNLAPGKAAMLTMQIHPGLLQSAPATIPVWHYLRGPEPSNLVPSRRGLWQTDGMATRVGSFYQTVVTHFSAVNMDLEFNSAACTIIKVDTGVIPVPFKLRVTFPNNANLNLDSNHQDQIISDPLNIVVREPPGVVVQFDIVDIATGIVIPGTSQTITIGAASPDGLNWQNPADPATADCKSEVDYNDQTLTLAGKGHLPAHSPGFLQYQTPANYLDPVQAPKLAAAYYRLIDPTHTKTVPGDHNDFDTWKVLNGFYKFFNTNPVTHAVYENEYDLGFGRDMYMQTGGFDGKCTNCLAFYVTNYKNVEEAIAGINPIATVAMEYSPQDSATGTAYTKFYVFHADGSIALDADLDGNGKKVVPTLCVVCHNGNTSSMTATGTTAGDLRTARFIPFDVESFRYDPNMRPCLAGGGVQDHEPGDL